MPRITLNEILRCKPGALVVFAPVCKSFSRMSSTYNHLKCSVQTFLMHTKISTCDTRFTCRKKSDRQLSGPRCQHTSGRTIYRPYGNVDHIFVKTGNLLASRVVLMIFICCWLNLRWVLEQPSGSSMHLLPRYQYLWSIVEVSCKCNYHVDIVLFTEMISTNILVH